VVLRKSSLTVARKGLQCVECLFTVPVHGTSIVDATVPASVFSQRDMHVFYATGNTDRFPRGPCEVFVKVGAFDPWLTGRQQLSAKQSRETPQQRLRRHRCYN